MTFYTVTSGERCGICFESMQDQPAVAHRVDRSEEEDQSNRIEHIFHRIDGAETCDFSHGRKRRPPALKFLT